MKRILHQIKSKIALNKQKLRKPLITIGVFIALAGGFLFYTNNASAAPWWTGGGGSWGARKMLTVTNNSSVTLSANTTITITVDTSALVNSGKLKSNCADLRILYQPSASTATELTRHVTFPAGTTCATSTATKVNFKIQAALTAAASSTDYYLYYKNLSASTPINTDNAYDISTIDATLVCPFDGTTTCAAGETPSTETGAIRYSGGKSAMSFDGSNDQIAMPTSSSSLNITNPTITVEMWVKFTKNADSVNLLKENSLEQYSLRTDSSFRPYGGYSIGPSYNPRSGAVGTALALNTWTHLATTYDGTNIKLYQNGILTSTTLYSGGQLTSSPSNAVSVSLNNTTASVIIDEVRISDTVRYSGNFTPSSSPFVRDSNTKLLLHMDENGDDPRNTGKALDDSGNGNHGTITGAKYVSGLTGVDSSTSDTGKVPRQTYAAHEGVSVEEGKTNKITNPSFEHETYSTNWSAGANLTATSNTTAPYFKFGVKSAKVVASASAISTNSNMYYTSINAGSTATHTISAYVYDGTSGNVGGIISSSIAKIVYNGTAQTTTYTDMGGGWWRLSYSATGINAAADYGVEAQVSKTIYIDGVQLEDSSSGVFTMTTSTYIDGSLGTNYSWNGSANDSTSTRTATTLEYLLSENGLRASGSVSFWYKLDMGWVDHGNFQLFDIFDDSNTLISVRHLYCQWQNVFLDGGGVTRNISGSCGGQASKQGKWQHVTFTWQDGAQAFYLNGSSLITATYSTTSTITGTGKIALGRGGGFNGTVSDLRIYDTAVSATQVTDLYQSGLVSHTQANQVDAFGDTEGENAYASYHFDEAQGSTIYDSSLLANNMTLGTGSSAPTWAVDAGVSNSATKISSLKFDGSNDYVYRAYDADFDPSTSSFTVSGSFRHGNTISGTDTLFARYGSAGYKIYMNSSGYLCFGIDDDSTWGPDDSACSTVSYADSKWHTFSAVKTSTSSIAMYIDGVLAGSDSSLSATATLNTSSSTSAYMGIDSDFASNSWIGNLDEFYFYSYARSAAQIKTDATGNGGAAVLGAQSNDPLMNGLMGYWKMDETTWNGTTSEVVDSSGNGNHGTAINGTITAPVKLGIGGSFDGVNDHITVGSSVPQVSNEMTVSSWVTPGDISSHKVILDRYSDRTDGYGLAIYTSQLDFYVMQDSVSKYWRSSAVFAAGQTYHVAVRYKNGEAFGYVNGQPITWSTTPTGMNGSIAAQSGVTYLGSQGGYGNYYYGKLDEFRIYNRALSTAEVQQLYNYAPGPVGHWKFDEGQGLSAFDSSGNGNTGTLGTLGVGIPSTWKPGKFGTGMKYDNVDDLVTISDSNSLDTPAGLTIEGWLNFSSVTAGSDNGVFAKWGSGWFVESNYSGNNWRIRVTHSDSTYTEIQADIGTNTANRWYHVAITYDKSNLKVYRDGILVTSSPATKDLLTNSNPLYIGYSGASGGASHFFPGTIDDVRMYNYGRSQAQVIQDMNAGHPLGGSPVGSQVAHWKLDEGQGTTANDSSINSNSLTLSSATSAWTNNGKFGKAWNGDGALYMSRADDADFDFSASEDFAISGWVKSDSASNPGATEYVVNKANATTAGYAVYFNTSGNLCFGIDDDTTWGPDIASCSTTDVYDAAWHHFSAMRDYSGTLKTFIYVDGISRDSDTDSTSATFANSLSLYVGDRDGTNNGDEFTGDIDEVKIYRGTLTPAEIKIDYNRGQSLVLGSVSNNSSYAPNAANQEYCVPGDATSCAAPVGEWRLDERTGSTVNDTSGNGYSGTLTLGPSWTKGKIGAALNFDGSDDYVDFGTAAGLDLTSSMTFSAWINSSSFASQQRVFQRRGAGGYGFTVLNSTTIRFTQFGVVDKDITVSALSANTWYHVTWVFNDTADTVTVYLNGQNVGSTALTSAIVSVPASSNIMGGTGNIFSGKIDHATLYDYARTASQIAWDYNRGAPTARYRLDECSGAVANDASGNGNTGTISIGATGSNTSVGNCTSGTSTHAWYNGVSGKFNGSLKFDGTDDYITVTDTANVRFDESTKDFSLFSWVKRTTTGTEYIISKEDSDNDGWRMLFNSSDQVVCSEDATDVTSMRTITDTNWHHIGCTIDRDGNGQIYIDGVANGSTVAMGTDAMATTSSVYIGARSYTSTSYFNGQIDDIRIYNYALTATQIKNVMNGDFAARYGPASGQP